MIADAKYLETLWRRYRQVPHALTKDWQNAFQFIETVYGDPYSGSAPEGGGEANRLQDYLRRFGHLHARLDPLGLASPPPLPHGLHSGAVTEEAVEQLYCGTVAVETGHLDSMEMSDWVQCSFEAMRREPVALDVSVYQKLIETEMFDQFLATKYPGKKRFGSEGADAILPLLHHLREQAAAAGIDELVIGSMHRGRLSILANFLQMNLGSLLARIGGSHPFPDAPDLAADVSYHLGHEMRQGGMRTVLMNNPSHLEAVNPLVIGYTRARRARGSGRAMAVVLHTDASVVGQGVNAELLQMSTLAGFAVGGTLHIVINNQIGFTTEPSEARSSLYCTGGWRAVDSLIVHANGDDVGGVLQAGKLALDFRNRFGRDAIIDLICYRANGHNEIDEPRFTQPLYYRAVDAREGVVAGYERKLIEAGRISPQEVASRRAAVRLRLEQSFAGTSDIAPRPPALAARAPVKPLSITGLQTLVERLSRVPEGSGNAKMIKLMERRREESKNGISWALAEAMALGSMLEEGVPVRFCGQDVERGPFSQRHFAAIAPETGARTHMLRDFARNGATFEVVNSLLSEYAVLGFEYGYALGSPETFCVWEAQFGDFANGAQIVIDQFIASGFEKWRETARLTVLLPHGLEGQGPEHSSGRIERLLQLCARENIAVAHPSTPANYFHLLREQASSGDKPLFIFTPKMLLRLPQAKSALKEFGSPAGFTPVIAPKRGSGTRAILCSGKIAYELERERDERRAGATIVRLESLYPFPAAQLTESLSRLGPRELLWLQEEPENFGAGSWLMPRLAPIASRLDVKLLPMVARPESPSPAGSFHGNHNRDQRRLLLQALGLDQDDG